MWWLRWHLGRFFRSVMKPIPPEVAKKKELKAIFLYVFVAWNVLGYGVYKMITIQDQAKEIDQLHTSHVHKSAMNMKPTKIVHYGRDGRQDIEFDEQQYRLEMRKRYKEYMEKVKETEAV